MDSGLEVIGKAVSWVILGFTVAWVLDWVLNRWFPRTKEEREEDRGNEDDTESD